MTTTLDTSDRYATARKAMVDSQLRTSGVNAPFVLDRIGTVARESFLPEELRHAAYTDRAIRLPDSGVLPAPVFHGMLLEEARPRGEDTVLIVDGGSGYLPELVRPMVTSVESVDVTAGVAGKAKARDVSLLLIDGAIEELPKALGKRLADGGRIVTGLVERGVTRLATGRKVAGGVSLVAVAETGIPRLSAFDAPPRWSF